MLWGAKGAGPSARDAAGITETRQRNHDKLMVLVVFRFAPPSSICCGAVPPTSISTTSFSPELLDGYWQFSSGMVHWGPDLSFPCRQVPGIPPREFRLPLLIFKVRIGDPLPLETEYVRSWICASRWRINTEEGACFIAGDARIPHRLMGVMGSIRGSKDARPRWKLRLCGRGGGPTAPADSLRCPMRHPVFASTARALSRSLSAMNRAFISRRMIWRATRRISRPLGQARRRPAPEIPGSGGFGRITAMRPRRLSHGMKRRSGAAFAARKVLPSGRRVPGFCQALGLRGFAGWERAGFGEGWGFRWKLVVEERAGGAGNLGARADFVGPDGFVAWLVVTSPRAPICLSNSQPHA